MKAPFKVGDKVKILPRDYHSAIYRNKYVDDMTKYAGQIATICRRYWIEENPTLYNDDGCVYSLDVDNKMYN